VIFEVTNLWADTKDTDSGGARLGRQTQKNCFVRIKNPEPKSESVRPRSEPAVIRLSLVNTTTVLRPCHGSWHVSSSYHGNRCHAVKADIVP
jgi:hypothetical protein